MLNAILFGEIARPVFYAIIFLFVLIISYSLQYRSCKKSNKKIKLSNHIFVWFVSLVFGTAIIFIFMVAFSQMKMDVYTDKPIKQYELCNYKDYAAGFDKDVYVLKDSLNPKSDSYVLIKTNQKVNPLVVTPKEFEHVIINIVDDAKPSYVEYERIYRNIYVNETYIQHIINIPRGTLKIKQ